LIDYIEYPVRAGTKMTDELRTLALFLIILTLTAALFAIGYYFATVLFPHQPPTPPPSGFSCPLCRWT
jgi:hypothetical protein